MKKLSLKSAGNLTVDEAFKDFKGHCRVKNLSGETIKLYQYQFNVFHRFLDDEAFLISDVTLAVVNSFILELRSDKHVCNDVTVNTYLRGLRAFLYYCMEMDYMAAFKIRIPKVDKKFKETYTDAELDVLLKKPNLKTCGFSEYKIWVFSNYLLGTGNRISTAINLQIKDINFDSSMITLNHTKNRIAQIIPLSQTLANILREYLKYRKGEAEDYVFCNTYGNKGDIRTYQDMLAAYNWGKGVEKTSAHLYRHTFAKKWILNGGDIFRLQKILGHSDLSVVKEYVQMFGNDLSVDFDKFNPLDRTVSPNSCKKIAMAK
ncbi:MAG: tyrosine-type recombinase/integrase [Lachnospiraceae bacterium]|nr:tyrosine-type recombinase/integrase [Butyrivibrio sp.]MCM1409150.1 tyrosine-type recombinase/integrase [Lachnospiraceae bacterium]